MTKKKLLVILISIAFAFVVLFSCATLLAVKKVEVDYALVNADVQDVQNILDKNLNKNLLFLDENEVVDLLKNKPYLEVVSVYKKFPNVLSVSVKERREVYRVETQSASYILDENGVVLNDTGEIMQNNEIINLSFITFENNPAFTSKVEIVGAELGEKLQTSNDQVFYQTLKIAKNVGLFDCIKSIVIECVDPISWEDFDVEFLTKTGVSLKVMDLLVDGERKGQVCFDAYNEKATDYQKRFGNILGYYSEGKLTVTHTFEGQPDTLFEDI